MKTTTLCAINRELEKRFGGRVRADDKQGATVVSGELDSWSDIIAACRACVTDEPGRHVVNDIVYTARPLSPSRLPKCRDLSLDGLQPDILIIGGGVIGAAILRELSRWKLDCLLIDKEADLALHASGHNDGEIHPGVDLKRGSLKQKYVVRGNRMFDALCRDLSVPFTRPGQHVGFEKTWQRPLLRLFGLQRRAICGVKDTRVALRRKLRHDVPGIAPGARFSLYNPMAGCVSPYLLTIAYAENAVENGARVSLGTAALGMEVKDGRILSVETNRGVIRPRLVINCAGVFAEDIARMAGDRFFSIHPRKGTDLIMDKSTARLTHSVVSRRPSKKSGGNTKGGGVIPTVDGNLLVGPDAVETPDKEDFSTDRAAIEALLKKHAATLPMLSGRDVIAYFTGVRAATFEEDFIIEPGRGVRNLYHVAGIQSPGLTCAPAIAEDVAKAAVNMLSAARPVAGNEGFNPVRKAPPVLRALPAEERARLIAARPDYGQIVCRCEEISRGEILDALRSPIPVCTVDGVKKRVRPGMGRCQGGFCMPLVARILSEHLHVPISEIMKSGSDSNISFGRLKHDGTV